MTAENIIEWFSFNNLRTNDSKWHLFLSPYPCQPISVNIRGSIIESSNYERLQGTHTQRVTFHSNIIPTEFVAKQVKNFLHCIGWQNTFLQIKSVCYSNLHNFTIQLLSNTLENSLLCHARGLNNKINKVHERALRIVYHHKISVLEIH